MGKGHARTPWEKALSRKQVTKTSGLYLRFRDPTSNRRLPVTKQRKVRRNTLRSRPGLGIQKSRKKTPIHSVYGFSLTHPTWGHFGEKKGSNLEVGSNFRREKRYTKKEGGLKS